MNDRATIFAVSSGSGRAGIAVVRVSGQQSRHILQTLAGELPTARRAVLRNIYSADGSELIDRAMVLYFLGPHSATGEDIVEFHIHGSPIIAERLMMELAGFENCRPAEAGEFSRRAFENERMDFVEVEGLADLLAAETEAQRKLAMRQFSGEASTIYATWHRELTGVLAIIEASIDFADEDGVAAQAVAMARPRLSQFVAMLSEALRQSEKAALVRRGLRIVIAGAPNVGKSSLLNALIGRSAAIVSDIAGTTRDVVEAAMLIDGLPVSLADTAGLRDETNDQIEREGIKRSQDEVASADILIWVTTGRDDLDALPSRKPDVIVRNKSDLVYENSIQLRNESEIAVSARTGDGLEALKQRLSQLVSQRTELGEAAVMVRVRHRNAIEQSIRSLNDALAKPDDALELMAEDVRKAALTLASITGRVGVEDFLGRIFSEFCIGK